jgi:hypothetical protein
VPAAERKAFEAHRDALLLQLDGKEPTEPQSDDADSDLNLADADL